MKITIKILFIYVLSIHLLYAGVLEEEMYFHLSKPFYVEGETLYFKAYKLRDKNLDKRKFNCLVGLYSPNGEKMIDKFVIKEIENGMVNGEVKISNIEGDGFFHLRLFTNNQVYSVKVPIYKKELPQEYFDKITVIYDELEPELISGSLVLKMQKDTFDAKEQINVHVGHTNQNKVLNPLNYSVSSYRYFGDLFSTILKSDPLSYNLVVHLGISGVVNSVIDDELLTNKLIVGYFLHSQVTISTYSDNEGFINIPLDEINQEDKMYLQAFEPDGKRIGEAKLTKSKEFNIPIIPEIPDNEPRRSERINSYIDQIIKRDKINAIYNWEENKAISLSVKPPGLKANFSVIPDNYDEITSVRDAVREIIPGARIKTNKQTKVEEIQLKNFSGSLNYKEAPLFFINEFPLIDSKLIFGLQLDQIKEIKVINDPVNNRLLRQMGQFGTMIFTLKPGIVNPVDGYINIMPVLGAFETSLQGENRSLSSPYFTNQLYWNTYLNVDKDDNLKFMYSDDSSSFMLEVFGISEQGEIERVFLVIRRAKYEN